MDYQLTAAATLAISGVYFWTIIKVGRARAKHEVKAPAMTGPDDFERTIRVQANTVEQLVLVMPLLWVFAAFWGDLAGGVAGAIWAVGRVIYALGYYAEAGKRGTGFMINALVAMAMMVGIAVKVVMGLMA